MSVHNNQKKKNHVFHLERARIKTPGLHLKNKGTLALELNGVLLQLQTGCRQYCLTVTGEHCDLFICTKVLYKVSIRYRLDANHCACAHHDNCHCQCQSGFIAQNVDLNLERL